MAKFHSLASKTSVYRSLGMFKINKQPFNVHLTLKL